MTGKTVEVIAEIANAHQGDPAQAHRLAMLAFDAGADAVKFQVYTAEELLVVRHPRYEHFRRQAFPRTVWEELIPAARARGRVYCDVFGFDALDTALALGVEGLKVHTSDLANVPLLVRAARSDRRLLLSAGGATLREIGRAVALAARGQGPRPVLLHGFQSYPTDIGDTRLGWLRHLLAAFGDRCDVGFQDHVDADDPLAMALPLLAMGMGATVLEKHVTLDRSARGVDHYSSLNPDEFARFVEQVRRCETAVGGDGAHMPSAERTYRRDVRKAWVTTRPLPAGHVLGPDDLVMKRVPDHPGHPAALHQLLGRPLLAGLAQEHVVNRSDVRQRVWALPVARWASSRLPGKALLDVAGMPALAHLLERLKQARTLDRIVFCTTRGDEDDPLVAVAEAAGIPWFRGAERDVLGRMLGATEGHAVDVVVRVTGDDIMVDPEYLDRAVAHHLSVNAEYSAMKDLPSGTEVEVFDTALLRTLHAAAADTGGTEYLTFYINDNRDEIATTEVPVDPPHARRWRLTLDTPEDYAVVGRFLAAMREAGRAVDYRMDEVVAFFTAHPDVLDLNAGVSQRQSVPAVVTAVRWGDAG